MASTLEDFKNSFKKDIARANRFDVTIFAPPVFVPTGKVYTLGEVDTTQTLLFPINQDQITMRCENATLPGRTLSTMEQQIYGPSEKFPYQTAYQDMELTFIVDDDMVQKKFFEAWLDFINPPSSYNHRYKNEYASTVNITQYDMVNFPSYQVTLYEAYPIAVNQLDLDWSSDSYHKLTVTFAYTYWEGV